MNFEIGRRRSDEGPKYMSTKHQIVCASTLEVFIHIIFIIPLITIIICGTCLFRLILFSLLLPFSVPKFVFVWLFRPTKHQLFCVCVRAHLCWFAYNIPLELAPFSSAISYFSRFARNFADGICLQSWCNSRYREQLKQHRSTRNQTGIITHWSITYTMIWNRLRLKHMTHFISVQRKWIDQWNWLIEML